MINNTNLYNLSNYDVQFYKFLYDAESCKTLTYSVYALTIEGKDKEHKMFEYVLREDWVKPVILLNNELFNKSMNPDVPHLYNAGMGSIKHFLNMNPKDDNERLINLEYIERMQPIMKKYKNNMENFKKTL